MKDNIKYYFINHIREYIIVSIIFLIGVIIGILTINNSNNHQKEEITNYIQETIESIKNSDRIDNNKLFFTKLKSNTLFIILCGILGSTLIGMPILYLIIAYKGFSLGYTISSVMATLEVKKGIIFVLSSLLIHNILFIIAIFLVTVSGINLCKYIINNKKREQIKFEIIKHIVFLLISLIIGILAALSESYISYNLIDLLKKYL